MASATSAYRGRESQSTVQLRANTTLLSTPDPRTLQVQDVTVTHGDFIQTGGNTAVHTHYHYPPAPKVDIFSLLRLVRNFRQTQQDNLAKATPGTGIWIFKTKYFKLWLDPDGVLKILWGTGIPGAGKTVLASVVINELEARAATNPRICVGFIYFRYTDGADITARDVLEALVKQIVERHPDCASIAEPIYAQHAREGTRPMEAQLLQLLSQFTKTKSATFYILDALDESPAHLQVGIVQKLASLNVRLFITSRPLKSVEARVPGAHSFAISAQESDLDLHIAHRIARSRDLQDWIEKAAPSTLQDIVHRIKENCGGMFLHASLQLNELSECASLYEAMKVLEAFPPKIEDAYSRTWDRIIKQRHASIAQTVFVWLLNAARPMTIDEIERAIAACPLTFEFDSARMISRETLSTICCGLVTIEDGSQLLRLVHYTAKQPIKNLLRECVPDPHSHLAAVCMARLTRCEFQASEIDSGELLEAVLQSDPLLAYASDAWAVHARHSLHVHESRARVANFVSKCTTFPHYYQEEFDTLRPLHMVAQFHLPLDLIPMEERGDPNMASKILGESPLTIASRNGNLEILKILLSLDDVRVNHTNINGRSALSHAARFGQEEIAKLLLARPELEINLTDRCGKSALMEAAYWGEEGIVKLLLAHSKVQVNAVDERGHSALMSASVEGCEGVVEQLLARPEIKVNLLDNYGQSALILAVHWSWKRVVQMLLAHPDIRVNLSDDLGQPALIKAAHEGREDMVVLLLEHPDFQVNLCDVVGQSALMHAIRRGHQGIVELLLQCPEIQVNMVDDNGRSALAMALQRQHGPILSALLSHPELQDDIEPLLSFDELSSEGSESESDDDTHMYNSVLKASLPSPSPAVQFANNVLTTTSIATSKRRRSEAEGEEVEEEGPPTKRLRAVYED